jgi:predicted ATP-grasp superfamily ATP-dependent carboligase
LTIAIFEYLCSSGLFQANANDPLANGLLDEGAAMLLALCHDFVASGYQVRSAIEPSIAADLQARHSFVPPAGADFLPAEFQRAKEPSDDPSQAISAIAKRWSDIAKGCDAVIVIAPEIDDILHQVVQCMRQSECPIVAPDTLFLDVANDKWKTAIHLKQSTLPCIPTWPANQWLELFYRDSRNTELSHHFPKEGWVLKRRLGAGSTDMQRFANTDCLVEKLESYSHESLSKNSENRLQDLSQWIIQPWLLGTPCSLAMIANPKHPWRVLGAMQQHFSSDGAYSGGEGPLNISDSKLSSFAHELLRCIPGSPNGWLGIDFLQSPDNNLIPLEINARLTSSYLGYRQLFGPTLAPAIIGLPLPKTFPANTPRLRFSVSDFRG